MERASMSIDWNFGLRFTVDGERYTIILAKLEKNPNSKQQITSKYQIPIPNGQNEESCKDLEVLSFGTLEFGICDLEFYSCSSFAAMEIDITVYRPPSTVDQVHIPRDNDAKTTREMAYSR